MKLYLIRHGESQGNIDSNAYYSCEDWNINLTERGRAQAAEVANTLATCVRHDVKLFYSPYRRAADTAHIIDTGLVLNGIYASLVENPLLSERKWGELREISDNVQKDRDQYFDFYYRPSGGESFADLYARVALFFQELRIRNTEDSDVIIVSHGEWIRTACMYLRQYTVEYFTTNRKNPPNCCCIVENL